MNAELTRLVDGLKIVKAVLHLEKQKPDPERSRALVYAAQSTAEVLLRRLEAARSQPSRIP